MSESTVVTQNPLGTEPRRKLIPHYAIPATIALVVNALYNIVDQIFIGQTVLLFSSFARWLWYPCSGRSPSCITNLPLCVCASS